MPGRCTGEDSSDDGELNIVIEGSGLEFSVLEECERGGFGQGKVTEGKLGVGQVSKSEQNPSCSPKTTQP